MGWVSLRLLACGVLPKQRLLRVAIGVSPVFGVAQQRDHSQLDRRGVGQRLCRERRLHTLVGAIALDEFAERTSGIGGGNGAYRGQMLVGGSLPAEQRTPAEEQP